MKKAENFHAPSQKVASGFGIHPVVSDYGISGPIQVSFTKYVSKVAHTWLTALESIGIPKNNRPLSGNNIGASIQPNDINPANATRSYSAPAYLFPNIERKNLAVLTSALVGKINWASEKNGRDIVASGVTFTSGGKDYTVFAKREIILSGGSVNTPQILELSGIGAKDVLFKAGVAQIVDLPNVGENLQDHTTTRAVYRK